MNERELVTRRECLGLGAALGLNLIGSSRVLGETTLAVPDLTHLISEMNTHYAYAKAPGNSTPDAILGGSAWSEEEINEKNRWYALAKAPGNSTPEAILAVAAYLAGIEINQINRLYALAEAPGNSTPEAIMAGSASTEGEINQKNRWYALAKAPGDSAPEAMLAAAAKDEDGINKLNRLYIDAEAPGNSTAEALLAAGAAFQYKLMTEIKRSYPKAESIADIPAKQYRALKNQYNVLRVFGIWPKPVQP